MEKHQPMVGSTTAPYGDQSIPVEPLNLILKRSFDITKAHDHLGQLGLVL